MKKLVTAMVTLLWGTVQQSAATNVEVIMYLDTEMPCLRRETLSGRIVIRNKGDKDIKLLKTAVDPEDVVESHLYLFPDMPLEEEKRLAGDRGGMGGQPSRDEIKRSVDYAVQNPEGKYHFSLQKGESLEADFDYREIKAYALEYSSPRKQIPFKAELYLSPDIWIPVEVRPPIVVAYDAKITGITSDEWMNSDNPWVYRVNMGTNEFLYVNVGHTRHRLSDLQPGDVVTHSNKVITISQKDGKVRTIPEADIPRISAERAEEKRKARKK